MHDLPLHPKRRLRPPVFLLLGAVHLVVLPFVLREGEDRVVAVAAGAVYLVLAALDRWFGANRG